MHDGEPNGETSPMIRVFPNILRTLRWFFSENIATQLHTETVLLSVKPHDTQEHQTTIAFGKHLYTIGQCKTKSIRRSVTSHPSLYCS